METEKKKKTITFSITMNYENISLYDGANKLKDLREFIHELNNFMSRMEECGIAIPDDIAQTFLKKRYSRELENVTITTEEV